MNDGKGIDEDTTEGTTTGGALQINQRHARAIRPRDSFEGNGSSRREGA